MRIASSSATHRTSCRSSSSVRRNLVRAARESFPHVVCRLRGMVMDEERTPEKVESVGRRRLL
jgi:hypothetical protein